MAQWAGPVTLTDGTFDAEVRKPGAFLVDFWAEWCGPCHRVAPVLEEIAKARVGQLRLGKLNIDENPHVPTKYGVRGIPTMMIFHQGQVAATKVGALPKSKIKEWIESSI